MQWLQVSFHHHSSISQWSPSVSQPQPPCINELHIQSQSNRSRRHNFIYIAGSNNNSTQYTWNQCCNEMSHSHTLFNSHYFKWSMKSFINVCWTVSVYCNILGYELLYLGLEVLCFKIIMYCKNYCLSSFCYWSEHSLYFMRYIKYHLGKPKNRALNSCNTLKLHSLYMQYMYINIYNI